MKERLDFRVDQVVATNPIGLHNATVGSIDAVVAGATLPPLIREVVTSQPLEASSVGMAAYGLVVIAGMELFRRGMNNQAKQNLAREMWDEVTTLYRVEQPVAQDQISECNDSSYPLANFTKAG